MQAAYLKVKADYKASNLNMSTTYDDVHWSKWCAEVTLLLVQHLQRLKSNDRVARQVLQKLSKLQGDKLQALIEMTPAVVKTEPVEAAGPATPASTNASTMELSSASFTGSCGKDFRMAQIRAHTVFVGFRKLRFASPS